MENSERDFPIIEAYRNAAGRTIELSIKVEKLASGYSASAVETDNSRRKRIGYSFHVFAGTMNEALWRIRDKIKTNLATKYIDEENGHTVLTHDKLVGRITSSEKGGTIIETDGREITADQFWKILSMYEGFEISIRITEQ